MSTITRRHVIAGLAAVAVPTASQAATASPALVEAITAARQARKAFDDYQPTFDAMERADLQRRNDKAFRPVEITKGEFLDASEIHRENGLHEIELRHSSRIKALASILTGPEREAGRVQIDACFQAATDRWNAAHDAIDMERRDYLEADARQLALLDELTERELAVLAFPVETITDLKAKAAWIAEIHAKDAFAFDGQEASALIRSFVASVAA